MRRDLSPHTVYILGAGFSRDAGIPIQSDILEQIQKLEFLDAPMDVHAKFIEALNTSLDFIRKIFGYGQIPSLEDVFTLLDELIRRRQYCFGYSWRDMDSIRKALNETILFLLCKKQNDIINKERVFYDSIAKYFIKKRLDAGQKEDPFSIISLNWDCVLENSIYRCLGHKKIDVDYCCYTTPLASSAHHIPSITQKARGVYNVKVIKLHGSTNWMTCPNCGRLYTWLGLDQHSWAEYVFDKNCPRCKDILIGLDKAPPLLEPFLITPTFIKEFENAHIQMVWHNAFLDLCEAKEIVFIGYSLPEADYHLRVLFKKAIRHDAKVTVVLIKGDRPKKSIAEDLKKRFAVSRYQTFFGQRTGIKFVLTGVKGYFKNIKVR